MIHTTMEINGVKLDIQHDGDVVHEIWPYDGQQDLLPVLDSQVVKAAEATLYAAKRYTPAVQSIRIDCLLSDAEVSR
jgi:hypothetical protein